MAVIVDVSKCDACGTCVEVCPVECILVDPGHEESKEALTLKYEQLTRKSAG